MTHKYQWVVWVALLGAGYLIYTKWSTGPNQAQGPAGTAPPAWGG